MVMFAAGAGVILACATVVLFRRRWARSKVTALRVPSLAPGRYRALEQEMLGAPPALDPSLAQELVTESGDAAGGVASKAAPREAQSDLPVAPVLVDGAAAAAVYAWTWAQIDPHLFTAVSHLTHESIDSMADLGRAVSSWDSVSLGSSPSAALVSKIQGHLAEALAADHLEQAGHGVAVPVASNHPAWDLNVDGNFVNVKSVADFGSAQDHLSAHPDISVVVPHDAVGIPDNAVHFDPANGIDFQAANEAGATVFVDDALSHADTVQSATDGLEVASGHVPLHFPWATAAVSAFRESRLLLNGHTDLARAAKNVAVDTVAVGGAGALGAKGGAAIGTLIAPGIGTVVGALFGGIAGAFAGRQAANHVKRIPLDEARSAYERSASTFEAEQSRAKVDAEAAWDVAQADQKVLLVRAAEAAKRDAVAEVDAAREALEAAQRVGPDEARALLDRAEEELTARGRELDEKSLRISAWRRSVWPDPEALSAAEAASAFRAFTKAWRAAAAALEPSRANSPDAVFDVVMATPGGVEAARAHLVSVGRARAGALARCTAARKAALGRMVAARSRAVTALKTKKEELTAEIDARLAAPLMALKNSRNDLVSELRKAGVQMEA